MSTRGPLPPLLNLGRTLLTGFTQLIYPNTCWTCSQLMPSDVGPVCTTCLPQLTVDPFPTCPRCSSTVGPHLNLEDGCPDCRDRSFSFDAAFRMAPYEGLLRESILRMKHWTGEDFAEIVARLWAPRMAAKVISFKANVVVPVPLHWRRHYWRGFNVNAILAKSLARELSIPCWPRALRRIRATPQQTAQPSATARRENVKHAFQMRLGHDVSGKTILLVDDVMTTGATSSEAARALRSQKPAAIYAVVLAHGR